jgi:hypothetical protein
MYDICGSSDPIGVPTYFGGVRKMAYRYME